MGTTGKPDSYVPSWLGDPCALEKAAVLAIRSDADIIAARARALALGLALDFSAIDCTLIATATSLLARRILRNPKRGELGLALIKQDHVQGITVVGRFGERVNAMADMTVRRSGDDLPAFSFSEIVLRVFDSFDVSESVRGSVITLKKWKHKGGKPQGSNSKREV